jgi:hypothetical protein
MSERSSQHPILLGLLTSEAALQAGARLDMGALALSMWLLDPIHGGCIVGHVRLERDAQDRVVQMRGLQLCYEHQPRFAQSLVWGRRGSQGSVQELLEETEHGYVPGTDLLVYVHPRNVAHFLSNAGMPPIDRALFASLVAGGVPQRANADVIDSIFVGPEADPDLTEAPFSDRAFRSVLLDGAGSPQARDLLLRSQWWRADLMELAVQRDRPDLVDEMLGLGYPVDLVDADVHGNERSIHKAGGSPEVMRLLLARGASVADRDRCGQTPLHFARLPEVVRILLAAGADVHALDDNRRLPLHHLLDLAQKTDFSNEIAECIDALIAGGADPFHAPDNVRADYLTPFQQAVKKGWTRHVEYFVSHFDVDLAQRSRGGKTLLQLASDQPKMKELLRAAKTGLAVQKSLRAPAHDKDSEPLSARGRTGFAL